MQCFLEDEVRTVVGRPHAQCATAWSDELSKRMKGYCPDYASRGGLGSWPMVSASASRFETKTLDGDANVMCT
jgi:hypothetical protein